MSKSFRSKMFSELLSGVFIQGPFVCNALKKLSDERWEKFLGHFSTKGMHCSPILLHSGLINVEFIEKRGKFEAKIFMKTFQLLCNRIFHVKKLLFM